jgi:cytochrome c-type biogenesis protein CcmH
VAFHFSRWMTVALLLAAPPSPDPAALEREARQIETMLIAPCCWMQQVSEHQSEAADEVKRQIRVLLAAGNTRQQVLDAFVAQYGTRILVEPPDQGFGRLLHLGLPAAFVLGGAAFLVLIRRMGRRQPGAEPAAPQAADVTYVERLDEELRKLD